MQNTKTKETTTSYKIKVGASRQVAIPKKIYEELNLSSGDYLDVGVRNDRLVLTPKVFVEKHLLKGLSDIKKVRFPRLLTTLTR